MFRKSLRTFFFFILLLLIYIPSDAARIYIWMDENGVLTISDRSPTGDVQWITEESYKKDSQAEIRRYEQQRRQIQEEQENAARMQQEIDRQNEEERYAQEKYKDRMKALQIQGAIDELKRAEKRQERLADKRRQARSQWGTDLWDDIKKRQDEYVEEKRSKLMELENER